MYHKILADECVDFRIVKKLRAHGFDVISVLEAHPSIPDKDVLESVITELPRALARGRKRLTYQYVGF